MGRFDADGFVVQCRAALVDSAPERAMREVVTRAVAEPGSVMHALGEPERAGIFPLLRSPDLTILNVVWAPGMSQIPHDHRMWAVIGIYTGREENTFWRRASGEPERVEDAGTRALDTGEVFPLGRDVVHSVTNPLPRFTGALHVYGGEFLETPRSEWDPESLRERPFDVARALRAFEEANGRLSR